MCAIWDYYGMRETDSARPRNNTQNFVWLNPLVWASVAACLICIVIATVWIVHRRRTRNGPNDPVWERPHEEPYRLRDDIVIEIPPDDDVQIQ
jgi:hypothetical protein